MAAECPVGRRRAAKGRKRRRRAASRIPLFGGKRFGSEAGRSVPALGTRAKENAAGAGNNCLAHPLWQCVNKGRAQRAPGGTQNALKPIRQPLREKRGCSESGELAPGLWRRKILLELGEASSNFTTLRYGTHGATREGEAIAYGGSRATGDIAPIVGREVTEYVASQEASQLINHFRHSDRLARKGKTRHRCREGPRRHV
jgi:hypothetical protein